MLLRSTKALVGGAVALGVGLLGALPGVLPAEAATSSIPKVKPGHVLFDVGVHSDITPAQVAAAAGTFTQYTSKIKVGTTTYTYVIAGKNPAVKSSNPTATVTTELIPLILKFSNGDTWDPTKTDSCDRGANALARTQNSPIFKPQAWRWGGTAIGTGQVTDAFQRAEFWTYARPGGINPKFGVTLSVKTLKPITLTVPNSSAAYSTTGCGNKKLGEADLYWLDPYLMANVIPSLHSQGVNPSTLPIFLVHNFVEYLSSTSQCCELGYHEAFLDNFGTQTYALATYDNSGAFGGLSSDISILSHEVAEWQNDPYLNNTTPNWGHTGQVQGCQNNLEVGDPLTGNTFADRVGGFTYHVQQLAFFSWFYHQKPSLGLNGWYSDQGRFKTYAAPC